MMEATNEETKHYLYSKFSAGHLVLDKNKKTLRQTVEAWVGNSQANEGFIENNLKVKGLRLDNYVAPKDVEKNAKRKAERKKKQASFKDGAEA